MLFYYHIRSVLASVECDGKITTILVATQYVHSTGVSVAGVIVCEKFICNVNLFEFANLENANIIKL